jgi:hypothetical protein
MEIINKMEKYAKTRGEISNGDIILFRGRHLLSKLIQYFDKCYYNHAGIVFKANDRIFIIDSVAKGVHPEFLSRRMEEYLDFCVVRPSGFKKSDVSRAMSDVMDKSESGIKYDVWMLLRIAIFRKFGKDFKNLGKPDKDTCSEFARRYADCLGTTCYSEKNMIKKTGAPWITPQDFIRYSGKKFKIMFDESEK